MKKALKNKEKKLKLTTLGFTLIELLGTIIVIGIIAVMVVPVINVLITNYRNGAYEKQITMLEEEANKWSVKNSEYLPENADDIIFVNLDMLLEDGFIFNKDILDPRNGEELNGCITITKDIANNQYDYKYNELTCAELIEGYAPTFEVVKGEYKNNIEVNTEFTEFEVEATSYKGNELKVEGPTIKLNNKEVSEVKTEIVGDQYKLEYKAYDPNYGYTYRQNYEVNIVDTTKPEISFSEDSGIVYDEGIYKIEVYQDDTTFVLPEAIVTDNSCGLSGTDTSVNDCENTLKAKTRGIYNIEVADDYEITYYATDCSGNEGAFLVHIIVGDSVPPEIVSVTANTTEWVLSGIQLTVNATDNIGVTEYSFDGGTTWQESNVSSNYNEAGTIDIQVKDAGGNISSKTVTIEGRTEYGYQDVASWSSSYSTSAPSDGYYKSKTQYRVNYRYTTSSTSSIGPCGWSGSELCGEGKNCNGYGNCECKWNACGSGGCYWKCYKTTSTSHTGTTDWQDSSTSVPRGDKTGIASTRTVYAPPASWGSSTGWTTSGAYTQTTSRKPVTRTMIHFAE